MCIYVFYEGVFLNIQICARAHDVLHAAVKIYSTCAFSAPKTVQVEMRCFKNW